MADFPLWKGGNQYESVGQNLSTGLGVEVLGSASPNVKGAWVELVAATSFDWSGFYLTSFYTNGADRTHLIDVGVGPAASEQVIVPNLPLVFFNFPGNQYSKWFPFGIAKGSRVAVRLQCDVASARLHFCVMGYGGSPLDMNPSQRATNYGADESTSRGTLVTASGTAHVKSAYTELAASTVHRIRQLYIGLGKDDPADSTSNNYASFWDIAVGSAGNEVPLIPNFCMPYDGTNRHAFDPLAGPFPVDIPIGTRLSARFQYGLSTRNFTCLLVGLD